MNYYCDFLKSRESFKIAARPLFEGVATEPQKGRAMLVRRGKNAGRSGFIHDSTSLTQSSARLLDCYKKAGQSADRWELQGVWWAKRVCLESLDEGVLAESSWAPRAASFCWAARPAPILSWSRSRRRRPTRRSPCGLCTSCCQMSSLTGAGRSPWPSPERELQQQ